MSCYPVAVLIAVGICLQSCTVHAPASAQPPPPWQLDEVAFRDHVRILSSDEFAGRQPGTQGEVKTVAYLSEQFKKLGLKPGNDESFIQQVPLVELTPSAAPELTFIAGDRRYAPAYAQDMVIWTKRVVPAIDLSNAPVVFAGYGVTAPEYSWDDYAGVDVRGKVVLVLVNDPGHTGNDERLFKGRAMTYYGRWTYKFEEAARHGAAGVMVVHDTGGAGYGWNVVRSSWAGPQLDRSTPDGNAGRAAVEGWLAESSARAALQLVALDLTQLRARAEQRGFRAFDTHLKVNAAIRNDIRFSSSANVVGTLPGKSKSREFVLFTAHWDHLGTQVDAAGSHIYHGALDNASGVAAVLVLAQSYARTPQRPERTLIFLCPTGEESNLLGSAYYTEHPLFPLDQTVAALNFDVMRIGGPTRDVSVIGAGQSDLEDRLREAALLQGRTLTADPEPEQGHFFRSDQFSFAKHGVPALFAQGGLDDAEHGPAWGRARNDEYTARRYHQPEDVYADSWDLRGTMQDLSLFYELGLRLANEKRTPRWYPSSEFAHLRTH